MNKCIHCDRANVRGTERCPRCGNVAACPRVRPIGAGDVLSPWFSGSNYPIEPGWYEWGCGTRVLWLGHMWSVPPIGLTKWRGSW